MEQNKKRQLAQLAMAAVIVASSTPANVQAIEESKETLTFLAAHSCGGGGCGAKKSDVSYNSDSRYNYYQGSQSGCGGKRNPVSYNAPSANQYNTYQSDNYSSSSSYTPSYTPSDSMNDPSRGAYNTGSYNTNRNYNTDPSYSATTQNPYNTNMQNQSMTSDYQYGRSSGMTTLTEAELLQQLSPQGKAIYNSLDAEGKAMALQLASQDTYRDKNVAVKEALKRINERRAMGR